MTHNPVVHFEIHVDDIDRAKEFYENVFGWVIEKWESPEMEYMMVMTRPKDHHEMGINGGMLKRLKPMAKLGQGTNAYVCTISIQDFEETKEKILENGGKEAMPKFEIKTPMGSSWIGYFIDTEGNTFGIIENTDYIKKKKEESKKNSGKRK